MSDYLGPRKFKVHMPMHYPCLKTPFKYVLLRLFPSMDLASVLLVLPPGRANLIRLITPVNTYHTRFCVP